MSSERRFRLTFWVFFIILPFSLRSTSSIDYANRTEAFCKTYYQQAIFKRMTNENLALLVIGMDLIIKNDGQGIRETLAASSKDVLCFLRLDAALSSSHSNCQFIDLAFQQSE